jgi:hypothetical protein
LARRAVILADLERALRDHPDDPDVAWTLMRLERNDEALVALDAALAIDPKHAWSIENEKQLRSVKRRMRKLFGGMFGR